MTTDDRIDLYTLPHKSLRQALNDAGTALGSATPATAGAAAALTTEVLDELARHGQHEEAFIHPLVARYLPRAERALREQHQELERLTAQVRAQLDVAMATEVGDGQLRDCYRSLHRLVARNLGHLDHEEVVVMPMLWRSVPDAALRDVMAAFLAAHPEANALYRRWPASLTPAERSRVGLGFDLSAPDGALNE